jgi:hypothetical protein
MLQETAIVHLQYFTISTLADSTVAFGKLKMEHQPSSRAAPAAIGKQEDN